MHAVIYEESELTVGANDCCLKQFFGAMVLETINRKTVRSAMDAIRSIWLENNIPAITFRRRRSVTAVCISSVDRRCYSVTKASPLQTEHIAV
jgi:hypothetical protein